MRILWVKIGGLWPVNTGGRLRSFHLVRELAAFHDVTVVTTHTPGDDPQALAAKLPEATKVLSFPFTIPKRGSLRFAAAVLRSWFSPLPVDLIKFRVPALAAEVRRRLEARNADLCIADFLSATVNVPATPPVPVVFFAHNVEYMIWKRLTENERRLRRILLELEWRKLRKIEAQACAQATLTIAVSDVDQRLLSADAPRATIRAIPTGVDTSYFVPDQSDESPDTIVFSGSMDWYPNEDAVLYFLDAIWPRIRAVVPRATFSIVGRSPTDRVLAAGASTPGVRVTGTVDDVRPHVAQAAVYVVPLRVGGGTRLKIYEALAMAKAVVSTSVGAEGLPLVAGQHYIREDDPGEFAQAVVSLLRDPLRRRALGKTGRRLIETRYGWPQVAGEFEAHCTDALCMSEQLACGPVSNGLSRVDSSTVGGRFDT